jgi:hypothetical protein
MNGICDWRQSVFSESFGGLCNSPFQESAGKKFPWKETLRNREFRYSVTPRRGTACTAHPRSTVSTMDCTAQCTRKTRTKFGFPHTTPETDKGRDLSNRVLTVRELRQIKEGFANCREALGWDHDIMVYCHWENGVRTAIQIAEAVAPIKPFWLEDAMIVNYTDSWKCLTASSPVPICTGENLWRRQEFADFMGNQGCDIFHPDLRNSGGFLENKRIADMAEVWGMPMATHNTGSQLNTWARHGGGEGNGSMTPVINWKT